MGTVGIRENNLDAGRNPLRLPLIVRIQNMHGTGRIDIDEKQIGAFINPNFKAE